MSSVKVKSLDEILGERTDDQLSTSNVITSTGDKTTASVALMNGEEAISAPLP